MAKKARRNYKKGKAYKPAVKSKMAKSRVSRPRSTGSTSTETTTREGNTVTRKRSVRMY